MKKELFDSNPILKLTFDFSLMIIPRQLLRSGSSIGANTIESRNAESKAVFIHKMKIFAKEAEEAQYWLWLCQCSDNYPDCALQQAKLEEVNKVPDKIISTSKKKSPISFSLSFFIF